MLMYCICNNATGSAGEGVYCEQRRLWGEDRGVSWTPKNRRPEKLRDTLKECEVSVLSHKYPVSPSSITTA